MSTAPTELVVRTDDAEWSIERIVEQTRKIQQCMQAVMKDGEHFGVIPGTSGKPTLLKPGAEKLCLMFRLCPEYETLRAESGATLVAYTVRCTLTHITTGNKIATGLGSCNSKEKKYTRPAPKKCPICGKEAIIKGKEEYGGGWVCFRKKDGCGAKFKDGEEGIEGQPAGIEDPSDLDNTILKMACKRALVAAVLNGTAASDFFTQDLEDLTEKAAEYIPPREPANDGEEDRARFQSAMAEGSRTALAQKNDAAGTPSPSQVRSTFREGAAVDDHPGLEVRKGNAVAPPSPPPPSGTKGYVMAKDVPAFANDPMANQSQLAQIHILRKEINWPDGEVDVSRPVKAWPLYRQALAAYKTWRGERVMHSNELTFDQAKNLIRRMEASKGRKADAHARMEAETPQNVEHLHPKAHTTTPSAPAAVVKPTSTAAAQSPQTTRGGSSPITTGPRADPGALQDQLTKIFGNEEDESAWLMGLFGKSRQTELSFDETGAALALSLVWGDEDKYAAERKRLVGLGVIRR